MSPSNERLLQTGLIGYYIPHRMWVTLIAVLGMVFWMREDLYIRFMAHASLNGMIVATAVIVIVMAFRNIFKVQAAANLLHRIEKFEDQPDDEARRKILYDLRHRAHFIDNFYLQAVVSQHGTGRHLVFDDNQARIIKSKVGQRTGHMKNGVQYIAGVLVMLGLIGTFWGLLETITAVGEAMAKITESFGGDNAEEDGGMVSFIKAISKPLQGMGIAFSASLFGLSGSLIGGLLNSFCGKGMDRFIEHFSIWLDTRIPAQKTSQQRSLDPAEIIAQHNATVVRALEQALAAMGAQSREMFVTMTGVIAELNQFSGLQKQLASQLGNDSRINLRLADALEAAVLGLRNDAQAIKTAMASLPHLHQEISENIRSLHGLLHRAFENTLHEQKRIGDHLGEANRQQAVHSTGLDRMLESYAALVSVQGRLVEALHLLAAPESDRQSASALILEMQQKLQTHLEENKKWEKPIIDLSAMSS